LTRQFAKHGECGKFAASVEYPKDEKVFSFGSLHPNPTGALPLDRLRWGLCAIPPFYGRSPH